MLIGKQFQDVFLSLFDVVNRCLLDSVKKESVNCSNYYSPSIECWSHSLNAYHSKKGDQLSGNKEEDGRG